MECGLELSQLVGQWVSKDLGTHCQYGGLYTNPLSLSLYIVVRVMFGSACISFIVIWTYNNYSFHCIIILNDMHHLFNPLILHVHACLTIVTSSSTIKVLG